jgi:hypothetical protein
MGHLHSPFAEAPHRFAHIYPNYVQLQVSPLFACHCALSVLVRSRCPSGPQLSPAFDSRFTYHWTSWPASRELSPSIDVRGTLFVDRFFDLVLSTRDSHDVTLIPMSRLLGADILSQRGRRPAVVIPEKTCSLERARSSRPS